MEFNDLLTLSIIVNVVLLIANYFLYQKLDETKEFLNRTLYVVHSMVEGDIRIERRGGALHIFKRRENTDEVKTP